MTYLLLATALDDLDHIEDWVLANFGEAAANGAMVKLLEAFDVLAAFPHAGVERPDVLASPFRFFSVSPNWIVYEPEQPVLIHRIYSARMEKTILQA